MDGALVLTLVVAFVAVVFALEGAYLLWNDSRGPEIQRLHRRVRMISAGKHGQATAGLLKTRHRGETSVFDRVRACRRSTA
jgi:tight adherence protein B